MTPLTILLLPAVLASLVGGQGTVQHRSGQKQAAGMEGAGLLFETETLSTIQCAVLCMGTPRCTAVTVTSTPTSTSSMCRGHASVTSTSSSASASVSASTEAWSLPHTVWLEKNCSSDAECGEYHRECFAGSCLCTPGYYFSHSLNSCVKDCAKGDLRSRLLAYPNRYILDLNLGVCPVVTSPEACHATCIQNANARTCDTVRLSDGRDYCCLQAVTKLDIPASSWKSGNAVHYQKTCA